MFSGQGLAELRCVPHRALSIGQAKQYHSKTHHGQDYQTDSFDNQGSLSVFFVLLQGQVPSSQVLRQGG